MSQSFEVPDVQQLSSIVRRSRLDIMENVIRMGLVVYSV